jgi:hypothetical protein
MGKSKQAGAGKQGYGGVMVMLKCWSCVSEAEQGEIGIGGSEVASTLDGVDEEEEEEEEGHELSNDKEAEELGRGSE